MAKKEIKMIDYNVGWSCKTKAFVWLEMKVKSSLD